MCSAGDAWYKYTDVNSSNQLHMKVNIIHNQMKMFNELN